MTVKTNGYDVLMGNFRMDDSADPWGTVMGHLFATAGILYVEFGVLVKDFHPKSISREAIEENYPDSLMLDHVDSGDVSEADLRKFFTVIDRYRAWCALAGLDY